jgi:drug/metabolite transporter (DMT)-like permease
MLEVDCDNGLRHQELETLLPPTLEDEADSPTLKRVAVLLKQPPLPPTLEDVEDRPTLKRVPVLLKQIVLLPIVEDLAGADSRDLPSTRPNTLVHRFQHKNTRRTAAIMLLLVLIASGAIGVVLISRQNAAWGGLTGQVTSFANSKILLGLCIILAIAFTVGFNIISRISLSTTRHESAYTILWQLCCALLVPFFLPFDRFSISVNPHVLLLLALSVMLWALVDAFLFSAFKYEEASILSGIFPLNFVFTFVVSVVFFHSVINPTIVIGFLIIMAASLLIGVYHTRLRPSKGMVFALLYSFFLGVALGFNSEVVKSFSIPPYMFAAFLFPALANLLIFLRPKGAELRYELQVQWKKILLNAAVMDASFFFLLKAFQLGNVPQVVALTASSTLLTVLAGVVVLKEDKHIALKIIAAGLATLGVVLVQL